MTRHPIMSVVAGLALLLCARGTGVAQGEAAAAGYQYLSPVPDASYVSPQTRFVLLRLEAVSPFAVTNLASDFITVAGSVSGPQAGITHVAMDGVTIVHTLTIDFMDGEVVEVRLNPLMADEGDGRLQPLTYHFAISSAVPGRVSSGVSSSGAPSPLPGYPSTRPTYSKNTAASSRSAREPEIRPNGVAVPSDFPRPSITVSANPSAGHLFLENAYGLPAGYSGYTMILDNNGDPVWYTRGRLWDFKIQQNGLITGCAGHGLGFPTFDKDFNPVGLYDTCNGYVADGHELEVFADGSYLMLGYRFNQVDLSAYYPGGDTNASVKEGVIQEFTADGELIFQWRSWDYHADTIATSGPDFPHMNALDVDVDGHLLVSARHLSEVTKINRMTGEVIWRLGGPASSFTFPNDSFGGPSWQHDITALGGHRYLLFDNGVTHTQQVSRAVEYELDLTNMVATVVWEYRDSPDRFTHWMGSAQRLTNGNTLINFVGSDSPVAIEVNPAGVKQFEMSLDPGAEVYRVWRSEWTGKVVAPYLLAEPRPDGVSLVFNKFGDDDVDHYRIYGGVAPEPTHLLASSVAPMALVTNAVAGARNYFRVTAVSTTGTESPFSNEESLFVRTLTLPNGEMLVNGDFSQGATGWNWVVDAPARGEWVVTNGVSWLRLDQGGVYVNQVRLEQGPLSLSQGARYVFEFDASSAFPRVIEALVTSAANPGVNYSESAPFPVTPVTNRFQFNFTMQDATDNKARVMFNVGALSHDVYIDNVSLRVIQGTPGDFDGDDCVGWQDLSTFTGQWRWEGQGLESDLNPDGRVDFRDFARFADQWAGNPFCP